MSNCNGSRVIVGVMVHREGGSGLSWGTKAYLAEYMLEYPRILVATR
jgi:hypothetical protein